MLHDSTHVRDLQNLCLSKYQHILGDKHVKSPPIEEIVELIVTYYEDIIGCMPGNVYWFDENMIAVGCNKNVLAMFGFNSLSEFKGLTFESMGKIGRWSAQATESFKNDTQHVLLSGNACLNIEEPPILHNDGRLIYFLTSRVPIFDRMGKVIGVVGISIDITERKEMEIALLKAKEEAENANHIKTLFMENMSHDFKTPLNGIYGVVQILKNRDDLPEDVTQLVDAQYKSILRLNRLVESVLDFDRISGGKVQLQEEKLDLLAILESIVHNLSYQLKNKKINLILHYPPSVPAALISDSYAVTSVLLNLLSNAVKFTSEGEVSVTIQELSQTDHQVVLRISITDTGVGIPQDKLTQIFERFHRLELSNKEQQEGHGIGLSVVKELVDKLNGSIHVESQLGKGSTFTLTLPFKLQDTALIIAEWQKRYPEVRILLVNDNKTAANSMLERLGKQQVTKTVSQEVINVLQTAASENQPYHILIIDDEIQTLDPVEFIKIIPHIKNIPPCMSLLASHPQNKVFFDNARTAGYCDFIIKPILPSELDTTITQAWERWQATNSNTGNAGTAI